MKKNKLLGLVAMSFALTLTGCADVIKSIFDPDGDECKHKYGPWEVTQPATCVSKGYKEKICTICEHSEEKTIKADASVYENHRWVADPDSDTKGDCEHKSITGSKKCTLCGEKIKGTEGEMPDHKWETVPTSDPKYRHNDNNVDPTCTKEGLVYSKCSVCGKYDDVKVSAIGHEASNDITKDGVVGKIKCKRCSADMGYEFTITEATGFHGTEKMNGKVSPDNKSTWNIENKVTAGTYDIEILALMSSSSHSDRKWYNMSKPGLCVNGKVEETLTNSPDNTNESDYRYTIRVDGKEFTPESKQSWGELGLRGSDEGVDPSYVKFIKNVDISEGAKELSLFHGNIGFSLIISKIKLIPHYHNYKTSNVTGYNDRVTYKLEECDCGSRRITINALDGQLADGSKNKSDTPDGFLKLESNGNSISYKFATDENIVGDIYMVGRQDNYPSNSTASPYNCEWTNNNVVIPFADNTQKCSKFFGEDVDSTMEGYSKEGKVLIGEVSLVSGEENKLTYSRKGSYNIALNKIVIEGRVVDHLHKFVANHSKDKEATCSTLKQLYSACSCGEVRWTQDTTSTLTDCTWVPISHTDATCTVDGKEIQVCKNCGASKTITTEASHKYYKDTAESTNEYTVQVCEKCGEKNISWALTGEMIKDKVGTEYVESTTATAKTGKMADNTTDMTVYKFDAANRRVEIHYNNTGAEKQAMFKIFATVPVKQMYNCFMYKQVEGDNTTTKFTLNVNGVDVIYADEYLDKTIGEMGLTNAASKVVDGGNALANPVWIDYYNVTLKPGDNVIILETGDATMYSAYIGGLGLSIPKTNA